MDQRPSPEHSHASEIQKLREHLGWLFAEHDQESPSPWGLRRYVEGRRENTFDIHYFPETGGYVLRTRMMGLSRDLSDYMVVSDTLSPDGRFLSGRGTAATGPDYDERTARYFNELLRNSTHKPYGWLGRKFMKLMRTRYRFAM